MRYGVLDLRSSMLHFSLHYLNELSYVLFKKIEGKSAPGINGFTINWLRKFWDSLKLVSYNSINECYRVGSLTSPLRTCIIRLLRKGPKAPTLHAQHQHWSTKSIWHQEPTR